jgi:hypothetical protein
LYAALAWHAVCLVARGHQLDCEQYRLRLACFGASISLTNSHSPAPASGAQVVCNVVQDAGVPAAHLSAMFPADFSIWIDPGSVDVSFNNKQIHRLCCLSLTHSPSSPFFHPRASTTVLVLDLLFLCSSAAPACSVLVLFDSLTVDSRASTMKCALHKSLDTSVQRTLPLYKSLPPLLHARTHARTHAHSHARALFTTTNSRSSPPITVYTAMTRRCESGTMGPCGPLTCPVKFTTQSTSLTVLPTYKPASQHLSKHTIPW